MGPRGELIGPTLRTAATLIPVMTEGHPRQEHITDTSIPEIRSFKKKRFPEIPREICDARAMYHVRAQRNLRIYHVRAQRVQRVWRFPQPSLGRPRTIRCSDPKLMFGDEQLGSLADIIRAALMLRYNDCVIG